MRTTVYVLLGLGAVLLVLQLYTFLIARRIRGRKMEGLTGELGAAVASGRRVLAYFYSPTCAACRTQTPIIDSLKKESSSVVDVNIADDPDSARALNVMATPTFVLIEQGTVREFLIGAQPEKTLRSLLS